MIRTLAPAALVSWLLSSVIATGANQVIVVDQNNGPGTDVTSVELGVLLAGEGDILLIRPGRYGSANISNKSLTLIGDPNGAGERPTVASIRVSNLDASKRVVIRGVDGDPLPTSFIGLSSTLQIQQCTGPVVVEDYRSLQETSVYNSPVPVWVTNSGKVSLTRCELRGPGTSPGSAFAGPEPALRVVGSTVFLYESSLTGGDGNDASEIPPLGGVTSSAGSDGVEIAQSTAVLVGCSVTGGAGGDGVFVTSCTPSSDGGDGMVVEGTVTLIDTTVSGGAAGVDPSGCPQVGVAGDDVQILSGGVTTKNETLRSYAVESPIRVGQPATTTFAGVPGETVGLLLGIVPDVSYAPSLKGALVPGSPLLYVTLAVVPPSGVLQFTVPVPSVLPAGTDGIQVFEQAIVAGQSGFGLLATPSVVVILDASL